jgi:hypothetical protein
MADPQEKRAVVEGDASKVPVQVAPGPAAPAAAPQRPTKGAQLVFGGKDPQSPWGQIAALMGEGGKAPYTVVSSAVLAKARQQGKKPGSAAPKPKQEKSKDEPHQEAKEHEVGPAAVEEIFMRGEEFTHAKEKARIWAHPETATLGPRPLLVFLHGVSKPGNYPQLNDQIQTSNIVHLGLLAKKLIDDRKVEPLIIAAPTYSPDGERGSELWKHFDLGAFIEDARKVLEKHGLEIDDQEVSVAGHSGAGCNGAGGLLKIARQGAKSGEHALKVLGLADTCCNDAAGEILSGAFKKLHTKTVLYSLHRGTGGGGQKSYAGAKRWADFLGATHLVDSPDYAPGEGREITDYRTDGQNPPRRLSLKMAATPDAGVKNDDDVYVHEEEWYESGAASPSSKKTQRPNTHYAMTLNWAWYGLQRFYPRVSPEPSRPGSTRLSWRALAMIGPRYRRRRLPGKLPTRGLAAIRPPASPIRGAAGSGRCVRRAVTDARSPTSARTDADTAGAGEPIPPRSGTSSPRTRATAGAG